MKHLYVIIILLVLCSLRSSSAITWSSSNLMGANVTNGDLYGFSVSLYNNLAIVGAPGAMGGQGKAFLFFNTGNWQGINSIKSGRLFTSPNIDSIEQYGYSVVALSKNFLVDSPANPMPQSFLYYTSQTVSATTTWNYYQVKCSASQDVSNYGNWGRSIVLRDTPTLEILAGALPLSYNMPQGYALASPGMVDQVYSPDNKWVEQDHWVYSPEQAQQNFGWTVDWDLNNPKNIAVACAGSYTTGVTPMIMVSWVWDPSSSDYTFNTMINIPANLAYNSGFGYSMKMYINTNQTRTIIVGAPNATGPGGGSNFGAAFIYSQTSPTSPFGDPVVLSSPNPHAGDLFGTSVAIYDNRALVGAPGYDNTGVVFVYSLLNGMWTYLRQISPMASSIGFGAAISLSANSGAGLWAVIGAPYGGSGAAYLGQVECSTSQYGTNCAPCLCSEYGTCDYGMNGTGLCISCSPNYWGPTCSGQCSCNSIKPLCDAGPSGNGTCSCNTGFWGPECNQTCSCVNGNCDTLTGKCKNCFSGFWGQLCNYECTCVNGLCNSGISGNGTCVSCSDKWYGSNCDLPCTCVNGTCNNNPGSGTGDCSSCFSKGSVTYYGSNCDKQCTCKHGTCNQTSGQCSSCFSSFFGSNCETACSCQYGTCNEGLYGNGLCSSCNTSGPYGNNIYGPNCTRCTCTNGQCSSGISGVGTCVGNCYSNWDGPNCDHCPTNWTGINCSTCSASQWGPTCSNKCTCVHGTCNSGTTGDGKCSSCAFSYYGPDCTFSCTDCSSKSCADGPTGSGVCYCYAPTPYLQPDGVTCSNERPTNASYSPMPTPHPVPFTPSVSPVSPTGSASDKLVSVIVIIAMIGLLKWLR